MAYSPVNGATEYNVYNVELWTKQGTAAYVGGGFTTVSGQPSLQLQASINLTQGYYNGQMLARSVGDGAGRFAGQVAGALINFDPASSDTGQAVWNGWVIVDPSIKFPFPLTYPGTTPFVYPGNLLVATPLQGWVLRQQYLYGPGTAATDATIVQTAVAAFTKCVQFQCQNSSGNFEIVFSY